MKVVRFERRNDMFHAQILEEKDRQLVEFTFSQNDQAQSILREFKACFPEWDSAAFARMLVRIYPRQIGRFTVYPVVYPVG